jgi:hypothetical protein
MDRLLRVTRTFAGVVFISVGLSVPTLAADMSLSFSWEGIEKCSYTSPEIAVANIPDGTAEFKVKLKDLDVPGYNHGGGNVKNDGSGVIKKGALNRYEGPCPPSGSHIYKFSVRALDANGDELAEAEAEKKFP